MSENVSLAAGLADQLSQAPVLETGSEVDIPLYQPRHHRCLSTLDIVIRTHISIDIYYIYISRYSEKYRKGTLPFTKL